MLSKKILLIFLILLCGNACFAHGFAGNGMLHPLTGLDHLLAMIAIGVWSAQLGGKAIYTVPCCFMIMMLVGGIAGIEKISSDKIDILIALSVILLGLAISINKKISLIIAGVAVGLFGFSHGFAHGSEIPPGLNMWEYITGFLITTFGLHVIGAAGALLILEKRKGHTILQILGVCTLITGIFLFFK